MTATTRPLSSSLYWIGDDAHGPSDAALVTRARRGDPSAFDEIVRRHQARVYNLAYRMLRDREDAEDVTQEAFLRAFQSLPQLRDHAAIGAWISRIAANLCVSWLRSRTHCEVPVDPADLQPDLPDGGFDAAAEIRQALDSIPPGYKLAIVAFYLQGRSYDDAARTLGISVRALKTRLYRARNILRSSLHESPDQGGAR